MTGKTATPILVVDLGFSAAKYKFGGLIGRTASALRRFGDDMIVGDRALDKSGSNYLKTPAELVKFYPEFVSHVVELVGVTEKVELSVGLPYAFWKSEKEKTGTEISAIDQLKKGLVGENISKVHVFPQGRGGIVSYLTDSAEVPEGNLLAIDIGFNTIIATLWSTDLQKTLWDATYYKKGIHQMATQYLFPKISHHLSGQSPTPVEISQCLEKRCLGSGFSKIDIGPDIDSCANLYATDTLSDIVADLQAHVGIAASFSEVLFFGGGTHYLPELNSDTVKMTKLPEPEFANARGFEVLAQNHNKGV